MTRRSPIFYDRSSREPVRQFVADVEDAPRQPLRVLDLFSGIGGFSLGLERTGGFKTVAFCEISKPCQSIIRKHWADVTIFEDVHMLGRESVRDLGPIGVVTLGFPCQDISLAGPGTGLAGSRSSLFWSAFHAICLVRPVAIIVENVAALARRGLDTVLGALAGAGYDAEWDCVRAFDVGLPHQRNRAYITAYAKGDGRGPGRPGGLADGLAGLPVKPRWSGDPVTWFEERFTQPALLGMDDGLPRGLHRLGMCGNAVVPDIPELIGRAILATMSPPPSGRREEP